MRKKLKRIFAAFVTAVTLVSSIPTTSYAETRVTDIFEEVEHAQVNYNDMEYVRYDTREFYKTIEKIKTLFHSSKNEAEVEQLFNQLITMYEDAYTMYILSNIKQYQNVTDKTSSEENAYAYEILVVVKDAFASICKEILMSECNQFLKQIWSEEQIAQILNFEPITEKQLELTTKEQELVLKYQELALKPYTILYQGEEWGQKEITSAYYQGKIDLELCNQLLNDVGIQKNKVLGEVFIEMAEVRKKIAKENGYNNYGDYMYRLGFGRDYTQAEIKEFHKTVKKYIPEVLSNLVTLYQYNQNDPVFSKKYSADTIFSIMKKYVKEMSSELEEPLNYMLKYELYDIEKSDTKMTGAFTTSLPAYAAPFIFAKPNDTLYDFSTIIHEFGHYTNMYYHPISWDSDSLNVDIAEIHSQGFELLFFHFYPEIFGKSAENVMIYTLANLCSALIEGCLYDELQQYIYAESNLTLDKINQKYMELLKEYGYALQTDSRTEAYSWVDVPHTFEMPFYYISYAVSVAAAFEIWQASLTDFEGAVDQYLKLSEIGYSVGFQETLKQAGYENPLTEKSISKIVNSINSELEIKSKIEKLIKELMNSIEKEKAEESEQKEQKPTEQEQKEESQKEQTENQKTKKREIKKRKQQTTKTMKESKITEESENQAKETDKQKQTVKRKQTTSL